MSSDIHEQALALLPRMAAVRRSLHERPETGWLEFRTASMAITRMKELGFTITCGKNAVSESGRLGVPSPDVLEAARQRALAAGADPELVAVMGDGFTGFWADMQCGNAGVPCLALRFDMDANDLTENTSDSHRPFREGFASKHHGAMHACGHDAHVAIGLAVAEMLAGMKDELAGSLRFIFEPGEEGSRGANPMIAAGCVMGVDVILGLHMGVQAANKGDVICGTKGFLATTKFDVTFTGKSAHAGAAPQEGRNALLAACAATTNLHAIARHGDGVTRVTVGRLEGGQGRNIIPPNASLLVETRGYTSELDEYMTTEAHRIIRAAAAMWGCEADIVPAGRTGSGASSPEVAERIRRIAASMPAFTNITTMADFGAAEDFSHMMTVVQRNGGSGAYIQVGTTLASGHHHECFDIDEADMAPAAELLTRAARAYLAREKDASGGQGDFAPSDPPAGG